MQLLPKVLSPTTITLTLGLPVIDGRTQASLWKCLLWYLLLVGSFTTQCICHQGSHRMVSIVFLMVKLVLLPSM